LTNRDIISYPPRYLWVKIREEGRGGDGFMKRVTFPDPKISHREFLDECRFYLILLFDYDKIKTIS
jgi:hypothetical protein